MRCSASTLVSIGSIELCEKPFETEPRGILAHVREDHEHVRTLRSGMENLSGCEQRTNHTRMHEGRSEPSTARAPSS